MYDVSLARIKVVKREVVISMATWKLILAYIHPFAIHRHAKSQEAFTIMKTTTVPLALAMMATSALSRDVPQNVRNFYNKISSGQCTGGQVLQDGFYSQDGGPQSECSFS